MPYNTKHIFESWQDFLTYVQGTSLLEDRNRSSRKVEFTRAANTRQIGTRQIETPEIMPWSGCDTWEDALTLANEGWASKADEIYTLTESVRHNIQEMVKDAFSIHLDQAGAIPDVARYLSNEPECMFEFIPEMNPVHDKSIKILVSIGAMASVNPNAIIRKGAAICALTEAIEFAGVSTEVWIESTAAAGSNRLTFLVKVKDAGATLDVPHLAFCVAHPAALRRLVFSGRELEPTLAKLRAHSIPASYGSSVNPIMGPTIDADIILTTMHPDVTPENWILDNLRSLGLIKNGEE